MRLPGFLAAGAAGLLLLSAQVAEASVVKIVGEPPFGMSLDTVNNFYNGITDTTSSIFAGEITAAQLAGVNLLWAVQPSDAYTASELAALSGFLAGGGRIAFMGEHGTIAPDINDRISAAIDTLGGHITINNIIVDPGFREASVGDGQILDHPLTDGVNTYSYAAFAPLIFNGLGPETLMLGEDDPTAIMMGFENIGAGSIFLITDQNVWDNPFAADNEVMFENLLLGDTGAPDPCDLNPDLPQCDGGGGGGGDVPEPATMALLGMVMTGIAYVRRRRV